MLSFCAVEGVLTAAYFPPLDRAPPSVFNDVVEGSNRCVGQEQDTMMCCELGFNATAGGLALLPLSPTRLDH